MPGKSHTVDRNHIAEPHAHAQCRPHRAAQGLVEAADLEGYPLGDGLHVGYVGHPVVGIGWVDQTADPVALRDLAAAQILIHRNAFFNDRAAALVAQGAHGIFVRALAVLAQYRIGAAAGLVFGPHADAAIEITLGAADRSLVGPHQHLVRRQPGQGLFGKVYFSGLQIDYARIHDGNSLQLFYTNKGPQLTFSASRPKASSTRLRICDNSSLPAGASVLSRSRGRWLRSH